MWVLFGVNCFQQECPTPVRMHVPAAREFTEIVWPRTCSLLPGGGGTWSFRSFWGPTAPTYRWMVGSANLGGGGLVWGGNINPAWRYFVGRHPKNPCPCGQTHACKNGVALPWPNLIVAPKVSRCNKKTEMLLLNMAICWDRLHAEHTRQVSGSSHLWSASAAATKSRSNTENYLQYPTGPAHYPDLFGKELHYFAISTQSPIPFCKADSPVQCVLLGDCIHDWASMFFITSNARSLLGHDIFSA